MSKFESFIVSRAVSECTCNKTRWIVTVRVDGEEYEMTFKDYAEACFTEAKWRREFNGRA